MIMEMLGLNLDKMFIEANLHFSIEKIHWISKQLVSDSLVITFKGYCQCVYKFLWQFFLLQIDRIETIHKSGWVFVDVKPENFAIGKYDTWLIYIFGKIACLAKLFFSSFTKKDQSNRLASSISIS